MTFSGPGIKRSLIDPLTVVAHVQADLSRVVVYELLPVLWTRTLS